MGVAASLWQRMHRVIRGAIDSPRLIDQFELTLDYEVKTTKEPEPPKPVGIRLFHSFSKDSNDASG